MATTTSRPSINIFKPNPQARLRLFCFAYAGGGASIYRTWPALLPPEVELCAVQLPGREERTKDAPFTDLPPLIESLSLAIQPYLTKPFAFFGHSMGALVSFELTRRLRKRAAATPLHLLVSAHRAPQLPDPYPPIHQLPDAEFKQELLKLNGTPKSLLENDELMQVLAPVLRADFSVCETYAYTSGEPLDCPITAFGGLQDRETSRAELEAWRKQTQKPFQLHMFEGDHFFFFSARESILHIVNQDLAIALNRIKRSGSWYTPGRSSASH